MASFESQGGSTFKKEWFRYIPEPPKGRFYIAADLAGFAEKIVAEAGGTVRRVSKLERRLLLESAVYTHRAALSG